ncbi:MULTISPECIES: phytanoyl-CoA dioxygenase family protein [Burkholderia]|uniref:phytanoyl-CoA dioxygenase family protein n=1 Tax=Burkholderia TaxID=32008 RepID=UPI0007552B6A|nr:MULTISPECIES: phytanoyl-CoA dioxygenase family protein [Burkholderia]AYQ89885.1 phytanoyl-CoA dioxygenase [Burkholderia gladioli]KVM64937.1 phytanoyl-CoA dioxygenase [Burkholderia gladioli]NBI46793.1 phytanoyl-CoA dioxygenase [Burkholderia sp. ISTR5]
MLTDDTRQAFARDGAVVVRGAFADWIDTLRDGVAQNEREPGPYFRNYSPGREQGRFFGDYANWQRIAPFRRFVEQGPAAAVARTLMGSRRARIFHEHVLVKEAGAQRVTPWHHDEPYYCVSAAQSVSLWIPLDPVPRDTCVEFVAGSHRWGKLFRPRKFSGVDYDHDSAQLEPMPDIDGNRAAYTILGWDLEPGDAIAFDFHTVHGAPGNASSQRSRRVVSWRWLGDEAVYVERGGETSPPYPELAATLRHGDPLPEPLFPFVG